MIDVQDRLFANRLKKNGGKSRFSPIGKKVAGTLDLSIGPLRFTCSAKDKYQRGRNLFANADAKACFLRSKRQNRPLRQDNFEIVLIPN
jgi:hypothetical protein